MEPNLFNQNLFQLQGPLSLAVLRTNIKEAQLSDLDPDRDQPGSTLSTLPVEEKLPVNQETTVKPIFYLDLSVMESIVSMVYRVQEDAALHRVTGQSCEHE